MKAQIFIVSGLITLVGCAPRVTVDTARNVAFNHHQTYAWMNSNVKAGQNPLCYTPPRTPNKPSGKPSTSGPTCWWATISSWKKKPAPSPTTPARLDFTVLSTAGVAGAGTAGDPHSQEKYEAGTVVVDMVDARTKQLVWRGSVQNAINNPAPIEDQLAREVARIVERLPQRTS